MRKSFWIILGITGLITYLVWPPQKVNEPTQPEMQTAYPKVESMNKELMIEAEEERPGTAPESPKESLMANEIRNMKRFYPETEAARSEVRENPHRTPESLVNFAARLGPLVEKASRNKDDSRMLVQQLGDCVSNESVIVSARALCLSMTEDLVNAHPQLKTEALKVRSGAGADVIELDNRRKAFLK